MKTGLIIRHVPHEGIAGYREPIEAAGYHLDRIDVADPAFSTLDLREPDLLIMMGGPMGVYEQDRYPWIRCQLRRLALRLELDRPTLGVCFGAQMIAAALGARVYRGPVSEVGFHQVEVASAPAAAPLRHLDGVPLLHWHSDSFELPEGAELLASSQLYRHQAFRRGTNTLGLQFHAEMGKDERFHAWTSSWPEDITASGTTVERLRDDHDRHGARAVEAGQSMIAEWLTTLH
ncbi:MAG: glutamine amidotransferase [Porphyrobacter sp.]|nr:glutamine amidotransferase [Porphyrobacter sp.]